MISFKSSKLAREPFRIGALGILVCLLIPGCANARAAGDVSLLASKDEVHIDSLFTEYSGDRPGASVMIAKEDKLLLCKGYGLANVEQPSSATCETNFRIASVSKQFTAMAVLKLIDKGKLDWGATLTDIFPDFPPYGSDITVAHMLTHQSGLRDYGSLEDKAEMRKQMLSDADVLTYLKTQDSTFFPVGSKWHYSNAAYAVLAEVVAKVSGVPFETFMQREIFGPAGMSETGYDTGTKKILNRAYPYTVSDDAVSPTPQSPSSAISGDGSIYTSARDFFRWHLALNNNELVSPELHDAAYQPQSGTNGIYGIGWFTPKDTPIWIVEHGGASRSGFIAFLARAPDRDITVAVFVNRTWGGEKHPTLNIKARAHSLLSVATQGKFPMPSPKEF